MESTPEQQAEGIAVVRVLAAVLDRLVSSNAPLAQAEPGQVTKFHALNVPGIGILQYLERIHKYASCSTECFVLALIHIDRLIQRNNFLLTELNVHRVVITAVLLAAKFFDDAYYNNAYYAKVGGVLVSEMNGLEVEFLFRINFSLHVRSDVFHKYQAELAAHAIGAGLQKSGQELSLGHLASPNNYPQMATHQRPVRVPATPCTPTALQDYQHTHTQVLARGGPVPNDLISCHDQFVVAHHAQHITPSPPPSAALPDAPLMQNAPPSIISAVNHGSVESSMSFSVPNLTHTHPEGMFLVGQDSQFPVLQRHHSMPVTGHSVYAHVPTASSSNPVESCQHEVIQRSHLITPASAVGALTYPNHNGVVPISSAQETQRLLVMENSLCPTQSQCMQNFERHNSAVMVSNDMLHHFNHQPMPHHQVTHVVGGG